MLQGKKILLGITGGIAAYKCPHLVRLLVKEGAEVKVILTPAAADFVTANTLAVVSKNEVLQDFFDESNNWNDHVKLAGWADILLIAPLTANTLAKMASGQCDNLLLATFLSSRSLTCVAPAMDLEMYRHGTVKENLEKLRSDRHLIIPAETGELASGLSGEGRMAEPENIVQFLREHYSRGLPLSGHTALVNAGPTYEAIDPVRFIGNRSSGKMGIALAEELASQGAKVTLVLGPSSREPSNKSVKLIKVEDSEEMYTRTLTEAEGKDIVICAAAVADYKPANAEREKIKKREEKLALELVRTKDILAELEKGKKNQLLVGFALETSNLLEAAKEKLQAKNLDLIVADAANEPGSGFGGDTNKITLLGRDNKIITFELKTKNEVAKDIVNYIASMLGKK